MMIKEGWSCLNWSDAIARQEHFLFKHDDGRLAIADHTLTDRNIERLDARRGTIDPADTDDGLIVADPWRRPATLRMGHNHVLVVDIPVVAETGSKSACTVVMSELVATALKEIRMEIQVSRDAQQMYRYMTLLL